MPTILLATSRDHPQLTDDDRLLARALAWRGVTVWSAVWDDPQVRWRDAALVIVRSTWDYHLRRAEFLAWADEVGPVLRNSPAMVRWNSHKGYLAALARRGVPTIDTALVAQAEGAEVAALARAHGWADVVIKPAVSASAHETRRHAADAYGAAQAHLERVLEGGDALVQPYLSALSRRGELSLAYVDGAFSHAVRRRSALTTDPAPPAAQEETAPPAALALGGRVLAAAGAELGEPRAPLYARVDLAEDPDADGGWRLLELELIEPRLFFTQAPGSAERMAEAARRDAAGDR